MPGFRDSEEDDSLSETQRNRCFTLLFCDAVVSLQSTGIGVKRGSSTVICMIYLCTLFHFILFSFAPLTKNTKCTWTNQQYYFKKFAELPNVTFVCSSTTTNANNAAECYFLLHQLSASKNPIKISPVVPEISRYKQTVGQTLKKIMF